jgi:uncharacterized protein
MTNLQSFTSQWAVLLTTYRRDGTPVGTPVSLAVEGDRAFVRSPGTAWKVKRIRNNPRVEITPSTPRGRPTGPPVSAFARRLEGDEGKHAARALRHKHPFLQGVLVPIAHRVLRCGTAYFELRVQPPTNAVVRSGRSREEEPTHTVRGPLPTTQRS